MKYHPPTRQTGRGSHTPFEGTHSIDYDPVKNNAGSLNAAATNALLARVLFPCTGHDRFVYCTEPHFEHGAEEHLIEGVSVRIYTSARTIADCFKYRNKIGLDVAIEALREGWRAKRFTGDDSGPRPRYAACSDLCSPTWKYWSIKGSVEQVDECVRSRTDP